MSGHSGIKISEIIKMSSDPNNIKPEIRKANIRSMTVSLSVISFLLSLSLPSGPSPRGPSFP
jgi:hypothetical protein